MLKASETISIAGTVLPMAPFEIWTSPSESEVWGISFLCQVERS